MKILIKIGTLGGIFAIFIVIAAILMWRAKNKKKEKSEVELEENVQVENNEIPLIVPSNTQPQAPGSSMQGKTDFFNLR